MLHPALLSLPSGLTTLLQQNSMKSIWKHIYPWIKTAVLNLESVDTLLSQTVEKIAAAYRAECLLWIGLESGSADALRVFGAAEIVTRYTSIACVYPAQTDNYLAERQVVQQFQPRSLPMWLLDQQNSPCLTQLPTGEVIFPITCRGSALVPDIRGNAPCVNPLQFLLQLNRSSLDFPLVETTIESPPYFRSDAAHQTSLQTATTIHGWTLEELESIEVICSQVGLAYSALYWRQRLEQSRQQVALVGRISRLLNSTLNPDEILGRIVAELGYGLQCDRSILVDLRHPPANILAVWDNPDRQLDPLEQRQTNRDYWQNVIEMFMQGGASYLQISLNEADPDPLQEWMGKIGVVSALLVPLFIQEEFFGAVALLSYQRERIYLLDELQTVRQVADQAAMALTNAQHYQSLWHKKEVLLRQNNTLQQEVLRDELTQLMNRRSLERELEQISTKAVWTIQSPFSIIVCDIDYFKLINDIHGHLIGDEVLQALAQRLQGQLRRGTSAYRYGGEEFVVILTETMVDRAVDVAERLRQAVRSQPIRTKTGEIEVTASFGVAQQDASQDQTAWEVLQRADRALYEAKRQGRDRVFPLLPS